MWLWPIACTPETSTVAPVPTGTPVVHPPADPRIGLVRVWELSLSVAAPVALTVEGGDETWELSSPAGRTHRVPLLGLLADTTYRVSATAGGAALDVVEFTTEPLPTDLPYWPTIDALAYDPAAVEPGWTLVPVAALNTRGAVALMLDEQLRVRWWLDEPVDNLWEIVPDGVGGVWLHSRPWTEHLTYDGQRLLFDDDPTYSDVHELHPDGQGGWWTFRPEDRVMAIPDDYGSTTLVDTLVHEDVIVHRGPDGSEQTGWSLLDVLDPAHGGFDSLHVLSEGSVDFVHANAILPLADGGAVVNTRNQDVVVRLDADGQIVWMLGDPAGWSEPWQDLLLTPTPGTRWPYHAHGPQWFEDEQLLLLFDNRYFDHTPYTADPPDPEFSRVVGYRVDPVAGTVTQALELNTTTTGPVWSKILGEAERMPTTSDVFAVYGWVEAWNGAPNADSGRGDKTVRLVEWDPDAPDAPVLDLDLWVPFDRLPDGIFTYRAHRGVPPLH